MRPIIIDDEILKGLIHKVESAKADIAAADDVYRQHLAVIRAQAEQIKDLKVLLDAQDALIAKLRYGERP